MKEQEPFRMPAEWETHECVWLAWPFAEDLWGDDLAPTQASFVRLCEVIAQSPSRDSAEKLKILVPDQAGEKDARRALGQTPAHFYRVPFGDIWMRDTAPLFLRSMTGGVVAGCFGFNGWGQKYILPGDDQVASKIAKLAGLPAIAFDWILEGGAVELDGEGTCLTTEQCLLNQNRNPGLDRRQVEEKLAQSLGVQKVLWLPKGLMNDHTDGHIDTLARFVGPGRVVCMRPVDRDDPNGETLEAVARRLATLQDAAGRGLEVVTVPSPGRVLDKEGKAMPASYVNFYIANHAVAVPLYGSPHDRAAVDAIAKLFPTRSTVGIPAKSLLSGGGAFHCITQQQPTALRRSPRGVSP
jgi:agmatine deiminase